MSRPTPVHGGRVILRVSHDRGPTAGRPERRQGEPAATARPGRATMRRCRLRTGANRRAGLVLAAGCRRRGARRRRAQGVCVAGVPGVRRPQDAPPVISDGRHRAPRRPGLIRSRTSPALLLLALAVGATVGACGSTPSRVLAPIPPLGGGARPGEALASAVAFPAPGSVEYRISGALPTLADHAAVYRAGATTAAGRVARLAAAFGLTGPVHEDSSGWTVDGGDHRLQVQRAGGLAWNLTASGGGAVSSGCAVAVPGSPGGQSGATGATASTGGTASPG